MPRRWDRDQRPAGQRENRGPKSRTQPAPSHSAPPPSPPIRHHDRRATGRQATRTHAHTHLAGVVRARGAPTHLPQQACRCGQGKAGSTRALSHSHLLLRPSPDGQPGRHTNTRTHTGASPRPPTPTPAPKTHTHAHAHTCIGEHKGGCPRTQPSAKARAELSPTNKARWQRAQRIPKNSQEKPGRTQVAAGLHVGTLGTTPAWLAATWDGVHAAGHMPTRGRSLGRAPDCGANLQACPSSDDNRCRRPGAPLHEKSPKPVTTLLPPPTSLRTHQRYHIAPTSYTHVCASPVTASSNVCPPPSLAPVCTHLLVAGPSRLAREHAGGPLPPPPLLRRPPSIITPASAPAAGALAPAPSRSRCRSRCPRGCRCRFRCWPPRRRPPPHPPPPPRPPWAPPPRAAGSWATSSTRCEGGGEGHKNRSRFGEGG